MLQSDATQFEVDPRLLVRYLTGMGWRSDLLKNQMRRVWLPEDGVDQPVEIFLAEGSRSKSRDVFFAINTISQVYEKPPESVLHDIMSLAFDVITSKIPSEYVRNDSIELRIASQYIEKMKYFLASSATTELSGGDTYKRVLKEGVEYSEKCRFGHTFKGSFGFHIESPVGFNDEPSLDGIDQQQPFERRVVERIAVGLSSFKDAVSEQNPSLIVSAQDGFSANMCDSLIDIIEDIKVSKIDLEIAFSPEWKSRVAGGKQNFTVLLRDLDILKEASKSMRVEEPPRDAQIFGRIKKLETDGNPADLLEDKSGREIEVNWVNEENTLIHVKIALSPEDYLKAVEAHKTGRLVSAAGTLVKQGRIWRLTEAQRFNVVDL
ncbi:hypothetical protein GFM44_28700 [Rhizobium leguminosarum bv. viciae]|nr:hypothetical protein [Rhizobium leguminosarum bv. viciae]